MTLDRSGVTRLVFLIGKYAIKIPNFTCQWNHFLIGLISNINEGKTWRYNSGTFESGKSHLLCPVMWTSWGGWILIMQRATVCEDDIDYTPWISSNLAGDDKPYNYGYFNDRLVKIDYGQ